jgi:hypothetical protein
MFKIYRSWLLIFASPFLKCPHNSVHRNTVPHPTEKKIAQIKNPKNVILEENIHIMVVFE